MVEAPPSRDLETCKEIVQRIVASSYFSKSARLKDMFLYLCTEVLDEGSQDIHELELGHHVFGRPLRYDTTADNIVRVHASMLRKRLSEYFAAEGHDEPFIIEIPRGNYAPIFRRRELRGRSPEAIEESSSHSPVPPPITAEEAPSASPGATIPPYRARPNAWLLWSSSSLAVIFLILSALLYLRLQHVTNPPNASAFVSSGAVQQFWSQVFPKDAGVDVVLDDASLEVYQQALGHPIPLAEYFDRSYLQSPKPAEGLPKLDSGFLQSLILKRQSNYADMAIAWNLSKIATILHSNGQVQFARELSFRQAKSSNLILLGNPESNPWIQLFESDLTLQWKYDTETQSSYPIDTTIPQDQARFRAVAENNKSREGYATVSFVPNLSGTGDVLIISGTGGAAIGVAMDWLLDPSSMTLLQSRLPHPNSSGFPFFEILLKMEKGAGAPRNVSLTICRPLKVSEGTVPKSAAGL